MLFKGLGVQKDTQTPCWLRPWNAVLTLPMLRLLSSKAQGLKDFWKQSKPCHVVIHWIALLEYFRMSTHAWLKNKDFIKRAQLHLLKLLRDTYRNQYMFGLPAEIWGSCRRIQGSRHPLILSPAMCQSFSYFSGFLHHCVLAKLATSSSIRVR